MGLFLIVWGENEQKCLGDEQFSDLFDHSQTQIPKTCSALPRHKKKKKPINDNIQIILRKQLVEETVYCKVESKRFVCLFRS